MAKKQGWRPKFLGQPYFATGLMRRGGSRWLTRMVRWAPGCLKASKSWESVDRDFGSPLRGQMVIAGRETWFRDDPYGRYCKPRLRAALRLRLGA